MPKYISQETLAPETNKTLKLDNLDKINNALDKGMGILDKIDR